MKKKSEKKNSISNEQEWKFIIKNKKKEKTRIKNSDSRNNSRIDFENNKEISLNYLLFLLSSKFFNSKKKDWFFAWVKLRSSSINFYCFSLFASKSEYWSWAF